LDPNPEQVKSTYVHCYCQCDMSPPLKVHRDYRKIILSTSFTVYIPLLSFHVDFD